MRRRPPSPARAIPWVALAATLLAAPLRGAGAQGTITVSALVGDPVTVTAQQDLLFTTVLPGVAKVVSPITGGASGAQPGVFRIQGRPGAEIELSLSLPGGNALRNGANALAIDTWVACTNTVDAATGCTPYVVSSTGNTARLNAPGSPPAGRLWVRVGATVRPSPTQPAGTYSGVVTLSAVYTGL